MQKYQTGFKPQLNRGTSDTKSKADLLIITATKIESQAVMDVFRKATEKAALPERIGDRIYHDLGEINGTRVFLGLSEMGASGLGASQQAVQKGIDSLKPSAVIMVGIAFGVNEQKQAIGDILVSKQLWLYELQRVGPNKIIPRGDKPHASTHLLDHFKSADLYKKESKPNVQFGLILSGEKLVDDVDYREGLKAFEPEAIGGEMEGAGLYVACQDSKVDWILVKAICDWADGHKADDKEQRQQLAATNAANFVLHALQMAPIISEHSLSQRRIPTESSVTTGVAEPTSYTNLSTELAVRFQIIKKLNYSTDQDAQLKQLIIYGLNKDVPELIAGYVQDLSYSTDRDEMYKQIFDHAVKTKRYHLAEELIDKLSYSTDQDTARKKLLKARTND
jgi:nucleoside phosphorylase